MPLLPCIKLVLKISTLRTFVHHYIVNGLKSKDVKRLGVEPSGFREVKIKVIILKLGTNTPSIIGKSIDNFFRMCPTMNASIRGRNK
jgi:hypothetical protein